jgi:hypothetical protein
LIYLFLPYTLNYAFAIFSVITSHVLIAPLALLVAVLLIEPMLWCAAN